MITLPDLRLLFGLAATAKLNHTLYFKDAEQGQAMQLIGYMDSPFVRRVAISMKFLGVEFDHRELSIWRDFEEFRQINPLVKVPTLVLDGGEVLVDSTLIIDYLETQVAGRSLMPIEPTAFLAATQQVAAAMIANEKAVSIIYETTQRTNSTQETMNMRQTTLTILTLILASTIPADVLAAKPELHFDQDRDLFLAQFDSKTDADDLHSIAAVGTMLRDPRLAGVNYHAVAGAYGIQEGLYIPSPQLFNQAFGVHWSDAHNAREESVREVAQLVIETLAAGGEVWVAEAGQSDFTADWLKEVIDQDPNAPTTSRVHVVQHSDWNESVTASDKLAYVQQHADYRKIADGNAVGNGTPGFRLESAELWDQALKPGETGEIWGLAKEIAVAYNGTDGRYDNSAIAAGGMDFSDVAETCWIFGFVELEDAAAFFREFPGRE